MRIALFGVCLLAMLAAGDAGAKDKAPAFRIESFEVVDLVGDPLITADAVRSLCDAMLELDTFTSFRVGQERRSEFEVEGVHRIPNIFFASDAGGEAAPAVGIVLEIERVYYGPKTEDVESAIMANMILGPILSGVFEADSDAIMGMVQYRATMRCPEFGEAVTTLGFGAAAGPVDELSRRESLEDSARRAAWELLFAIVADLDEAWDLDIDTEFKSVGFGDYEKAVDKWWDQR